MHNADSSPRALVASAAAFLLPGKRPLLVAYHLSIISLMPVAVGSARLPTYHSGLYIATPAWRNQHA